MKTLKIGMFAAALLLIFAGCKNAVTPTPYSESEFAREADLYPDSGTTINSFKVSSVNVGNDFVEDDAKSKLVTITFNHKVNAEGLKGIAFHSLTNGTDPDKMYEKKSIDAKLIKAVDTKAYYKVPLKDVKDLYIYFTAKEVKNKFGIPLNEDEDLTAGEAGDDDYAYYGAIGVTGLDALKGNRNYPKETAGINKSLKNLITNKISFGTGDADTANGKLKKKIKVSGSGIGTLFKPTEKDAAFEKFAPVISTFLKVEQYDWENNKWENIGTAFKVNSAKDGWESEITVKPHRKIRARWENLDKLEMQSYKYAYTLRYSLKDNAEKELIETSAETDSGYESLAKGYVLGTTGFEADKATAGKVVFKLTPATLEGAFASAFFETTSKTWTALSFDNSEAGKKSLFKGFDKDTLTKENFKFVDANGKFIAVKDVDYNITGTDTTYPNALTEVTFIFVGSNVSASKVFVSPNVKIAGFAGKQGTNKFDFPAMPIVNVDHDADCMVLGLKGWTKF